MSYYPQGFKSNHLIDVNQNTGLLSSSYRTTGDQHALEVNKLIKIKNIHSLVCNCNRAICFSPEVLVKNLEKSYLSVGYVQQCLALFF